MWDRGKQPPSCRLCQTGSGLRLPGLPVDPGSPASFPGPLDGVPGENLLLEPGFEFLAETGLFVPLQGCDILFKVGPAKPRKGDFLLFQLHPLGGSWKVVAEYLD